MGSSHSQPVAQPVAPPKPTSIAPAQIQINPPIAPVVIHGTVLSQPKHAHHDIHHKSHHHMHHKSHHHESHHHESHHHESHHNMHHAHHHSHHDMHHNKEHFLGLGDVTCESACNSVSSYLTKQNVALILIILVLAYYISKQK